MLSKQRCLVWHLTVCVTPAARHPSGSDTHNGSLLSLPAALQDHKFFDSADWALSKQGVKPENKQDMQNLEPKLEPTVVPPRRISQLGGEGE